MTDYEVSVHLLGSRNTHMKLKERAKLALAQLKQSQVSLPADLMERLNLAIYRRSNYVRYKERHYPGWDDLPKEITANMHYPLSGSGMAELNTMLGLQKMAEEAEAELVSTPVSVEEQEVECMIADYLAWKALK